MLQLFEKKEKSWEREREIEQVREGKGKESEKKGNVRQIWERERKGDNRE